MALSRTYILLFTLQADTKVIDYFSSAVSEYKVFVGTDILIKALSERYLQEEDQVCRNLLKLCRKCGMKLYLSNLVLSEIYTHIKATNFEFINHVMEVEPYMTRELVSNVQKILIRAYFYAKWEGKVRGWKEFINQFLTYDQINSRGIDELSSYLITAFDMEYFDDGEVEKIVDMQSVQALANQLLENHEKENEKLAVNSALLVHGIYAMRRKNNENNNGSPYGYCTWWLTNQTRIQRYTVDIVRNNFAKYIMRPEFILNFLGIAPDCEQVRRAYAKIFPSNLGIQLGHRLRDDVFHAVMGRVKDWKSLEEGRIRTLVAKLSDDLKSDQLKIYDTTIEAVNDRLFQLENA